MTKTILISEEGSKGKRRKKGNGKEEINTKELSCCAFEQLVCKKILKEKLR